MYRWFVIGSNTWSYFIPGNLAFLIPNCFINAFCMIYQDMKEKIFLGLLKYCAYRLLDLRINILRHEPNGHYFVDGIFN